jgi:hypothetical protein
MQLGDRHIIGICLGQTIQKLFFGQAVSLAVVVKPVIDFLAVGFGSRNRNVSQKCGFTLALDKTPRQEALVVVVTELGATDPCVWHDSNPNCHNNLSSLRCCDIAAMNNLQLHEVSNIVA